MDRRECIEYDHGDVDGDGFVVYLNEGFRSTRTFYMFCARALAYVMRVAHLCLHFLCVTTKFLSEPRVVASLGRYNQTITYTHSTSTKFVQGKYAARNLYRENKDSRRKA